MPEALAFACRQTPMPDTSPRPVLVSLGSINADFQVRVDQAPWEVETLAAHDLRRFSGGKATNVALLARRLGCDAVLLGRVGDDELAEQALAPLRAEGVDVSGVRVGRGESTAVSMIVVPPGGKKRIVLAGAANLGFDDGDIAAIEARIAAVPPQSVVVVDHEITPRAASRAVSAAHRRGLRVVIDPSFPGAVPAHDLSLAHALTPNAEEAMALAGTPGDDPGAIEAAARALARHGPALVCIKLSDGGCLWLHEGEAWHQHAAPVAPIDTTGAGDAFTGALAVALLEGRSPQEAARFAVAATELAVTAYGSQPGYALRERFEAQLAIERELTRWGR